MASGSAISTPSTTDTTVNVMCCRSRNMMSSRWSPTHDHQMMESGPLAAIMTLPANRARVGPRTRSLVAQRERLPVHGAGLGRAALPREQLGPAATSLTEIGVPVAVVQEVVECACPRVRIDGAGQLGG